MKNNLKKEISPFMARILTYVGVQLGIVFSLTPVQASDAFVSLMVSGATTGLKVLLNSEKASQVTDLKSDEFNKIVRTKNPETLRNFVKIINEECEECIGSKDLSRTNVPKYAEELREIISQRFQVAELILNYLGLFETTFQQWQRELLKEKELAEVDTRRRLTGIKTTNTMEILSRLEEIMLAANEKLKASFYYHYRYKNEGDAISRGLASLTNKLWRAYETGGSPTYTVPNINLSSDVVFIGELEGSEDRFKHRSVHLYSLFADAFEILQMPEECFIQDKPYFSPMKYYLSQFQIHSENLTTKIPYILHGFSPSSSPSHSSSSMGVVAPREGGRGEVRERSLSIPIQPRTQLPDVKKQASSSGDTGPAHSEGSLTYVEDGMFAMSFAQQPGSYLTRDKQDVEQEEHGAQQLTQEDNSH